MDTQLQAPVGYMQLAVPPNLADGVFTHNDFELVKALAVEISWNCSFTMSPARPRAGQPMLRDYYVAPTRALNSLDIRRNKRDSGSIIVFDSIILVG